MPTNIENPVVLFGQSNFRNTVSNFGIKMDDRRRHMYIIGKTGMGKSELLKNIAIQDIWDGRGLAFIDPHGDPVEDLLDYIPQERLKDVIYLNPADLEHPIGFNVMEHVDFDKRHLVADGIMAVFKKIWVDAWSARMEYILNNTILALLESPNATLLGINRMLAEKDYRLEVVKNITDPEVKAFWTQEFAKYTDKFASEATAAIQNKIGAFISNPLIRNIIGQTKSSFNMRQAMDEQKILLVNISKGRVGEDASRLLGALLITRIQLAAMSRVDIPKAERKDFVLVVDEFQNFATASFANILSEARKFNLSLVIAHQYVAQMDEEVSDAVFGNVGTIVAFRVGAEDAELLEKEFAPEFTATDIVNLGKYQIYLKLMVDGIASRAFSAGTMPPIKPPEQSLRVQVIDYSRANYGRKRGEVESAIAAWRAPIERPYEERPERPAYRPDDRPRPRQDYGGPSRYGGSDRPPARSAARPPMRLPTGQAGSQDRPFRPASPQLQRGEQDQPRMDRPPRPAQDRPPQPAPQPQSDKKPEISLSALQQEPPKVQAQRPPRQSPKNSGRPDVKKEIDRDELRKLLQESLGKKEEGNNPQEA